MLGKISPDFFEILNNIFLFWPTLGKKNYYFRANISASAYTVCLFTKMYGSSKVTSHINRLTITCFLTAPDRWLSVFFYSRHPSLVVEQFGVTPNYKLLENRCQILKLAAPLYLLQGIPVENHCLRERQLLGRDLNV